MPRSLQHCVGRHPGKEMTRLEILKYRYPRKKLAYFEMRKYHYPRKKLTSLGIRIWRYPNNRLTHFGMRKYRYLRKKNPYYEKKALDLRQVHESRFTYEQKIRKFNRACSHSLHIKGEQQKRPCFAEEEKNKKYMQILVKQHNLIRTLKEKNKRHIQILENIAAKFKDLVNRKGKSLSRRHSKSHIKTV